MIARSGLLIAGTVMRKAPFFLPYLVTEAISCVLLVLAWIALTIFGFVQTWKLGLFFFVIMGITPVFTVYFFWVVLSHYKALDSGVEPVRTTYA